MVNERMCLCEREPVCLQMGKRSKGGYFIEREEHGSLLEGELVAENEIELEVPTHKFGEKTWNQIKFQSF